MHPSGTKEAPQEGQSSTCKRRGVFGQLNKSVQHKSRIEVMNKGVEAEAERAHAEFCVRVEGALLIVH